MQPICKSRQASSILRHSMFYLRHRQIWLVRPALLVVFVCISASLFLSTQRLRAGICRHLSFISVLGGCGLPRPAWNLHYHLGGNGPWVPRANFSSDADLALPAGCVVDQVHMIARHAARYPTQSAGARQLYLLQRLKHTTHKVGGSLAFVKDWTYFTDPERPDFEHLTTSGPYAGTLQAFTAGQELRARYNHLIDPDYRLRFWSCSSPRDIDTARHFAKGFFGAEWEENGLAELQIIPETADRGADTLTPGDTCILHRADPMHGRDRGNDKLANWQNVFAPPISQRLQGDLGGLDLSPADIYTMMEICGFELLARGSSPWCDVFTREEWLAFEYGRDLLHFYRTGPANSYAGAMGWLWLNATQQLMATPSANNVYFSFVHDGDIIPLLATMKLMNEHTTMQHLPTNRMKDGRVWRTSDVVPMGARLVFERITCESVEAHIAPKSYVRLYINDGLFDLGSHIRNCSLVGGAELESFQQFVAQQGQIFGKFGDVCGLEDSAPERISFLHQ